MAEISYTKQIRYVGAGPLDVKHQPVENYAALGKIPKGQRYVGMSVVVLSDENNDGEQREYWLKGGTMNKNWTLKNEGNEGVQIKGNDID